MLKTLSIQNLATIESIAINLERGFNVLTGETGAGKSIIIGGLELALGGRASSDDIRADENIAVVEASFAPPFPDAVISSLKEI
ncbi:MAG TPA: AAA family ATPase, partial [Candidatus Sumerlaeota bacterium]|nr:AAA family ATPase [Candidatus Sumerlaeota bacterium]